MGDRTDGEALGGVWDRCDGVTSVVACPVKRSLRSGAANGAFSMANPFRYIAGAGGAAWWACSAHPGPLRRLLRRRNGLRAWPVRRNTARPSNPRTRGQATLRFKALETAARALKARTTTGDTWNTISDELQDGLAYVQCTQSSSPPRSKKASARVLTGGTGRRYRAKGPTERVDFRDFDGHSFTLRTSRRG